MKTPDIKIRGLALLRQTHGRSAMALILRIAFMLLVFPFASATAAPVSDGPQSKVIDIGDGFALHYVEQGSGPTSSSCMVP